MTIESVSRRSPKPGEGVAAPRHGRQRQPATRPQPQPGRGVPVGGGDGGQGAPRPQPVPGRVGLPGAVLPKAPAKTPGPVVPNVPGGGTGTGTGTGANGATPRPTRPERTERPERSEHRGGGADRSLYDGGSPSANRLGPAKAMRARDVSRP
jgi:hypothetical protein